MIRKRLQQFYAGTLTLALAAGLLSGIATPTIASAADSTYVESPSRVSVHDPSIFKDTDGTYYVFGSHLADAKSTDLINWNRLHSGVSTRRSGWEANYLLSGSVGNILTNLSESFKWAGYNDGDCANGGIAVWAPDVIYNANYNWGDGSKGAYMLYYCASSTWCRSCIGYAVSKTATGPYDYVDTVIYSGFTKESMSDSTDPAIDGASTRDKKWDNSYLNLKTLKDNGTISDVSDKWFTSGNSYNVNYAPNALDPTVFYGKDNKLYMTYGSWSGGIFILELDEATGEPKYPGQDSTDSTSGNFTDRYFGIHIAGGNHQSGEGPYILYDKETDYYYLYETYGGLSTTGGYNMRLFRSKNVYGPYTDAKGYNAKNNNNSFRDNYGIKLIGNYQFSNMTFGYLSAGHNSAFIDDDGQRYLIYHQRFTNRKESYEVRVRRQYLNEDDWPVETIYEYQDAGEKIESYSDSDVKGTYEIINHGTTTPSSAALVSCQSIYLNGDGSVTGDMTGKWTKKKSDRGYDYITITSGNVTYKGFFLKQYGNTSPAEKVMTFSSIGSDNTCLWGRKTSDKYEIEAADTSNNGSSSSTVSTNTSNSSSSSSSSAGKVTVKKTTIKSLKSKKKKNATIKWKKISGAKGYQIQYSTKKNFKKNKKTVTIKKGTTIKKTIKKLKSKKRYYFRVRAYKTSSGGKVYGTWSKVKSVKIK